MSKKRYRPEEIIGQLLKAVVLTSHGKKMVDVIRKNRWCRRRGAPA